MKIKFFHEDEKRFTVIVNGKEVTNPIAKVLITAGSLFFAVVVVAVVLLVVLPIVGVVLTGSLALVGVVLLILAILSPILVIVGIATGRGKVEIS